MKAHFLNTITYIHDGSLSSLVGTDTSIKQTSWSWTNISFDESYTWMLVGAASVKWLTRHLNWYLKLPLLIQNVIVSARIYNSVICCILHGALRCFFFKRIRFFIDIARYTNKLELNKYFIRWIIYMDVGGSSIC
jgi:hypothetical protein